MSVARPLRRSRLITLMTTVGVVAVMAGGAMIATNVAGVSAAATTTLSLTTTAAGASCDDSNPSAPICSGLAAGDVVNVSGTGFAPGALASIVQCNSEPSQPVIFFLGADVPVSCSPLAIVTIPSRGINKGKLAGTHTMTTGIVGPPVTGQPTTCTQVVPSTSTISGCSTTTDAATDAANYPCPPTPTQQAAGDTCVLAIGDQAGDRAIGTVLFGTETLPTSTTATTTGSTTTTTSPTSTATSTQVSASAVTLDPSSSVSDTVTVQGTPTNGSPTGSVNFYVCQTGATGAPRTGPCPATLADHLATTHLTAGANNTASAPSGAFIPTAGGTWCFSALYGGDSIYTGSADNTDATNLDVNECVLVKPSPSTIATFISTANVTLGPDGSATDFVTVTGNLAGGSPTGSVSFYACHTGITGTFTPGPCHLGGLPADANEALIPGAGDSSSATSTTFVPTSVGTWCFAAVYGGSATYAASTDNTTSVDANECVLVGPPSGDAFTSDPNASATAGTSFSFLVTTTGSPTPTIKKKGKLPPGLHFVKNHDGTATISGVPRLKKGIGVRQVTFTAKFGKGKAKVLVTQVFTITVA